MSQYDQIADKYVRSNKERPDRTQIMVPTAKAYLGPVTGLKVLDLACGDGFFTRLIKQWGAKEVVGVDISEEMIKVARKHADGITYHVADIATLEKLGEFDLVFAAFLLHYSPNIEALHAMCRNIKKNLKPGSRFISFNANPFLPVHGGILYDVESVAKGEIRDGVELEKIHYENGKPTFSFFHYHYEPATYTAALHAAGFTNIEWKPFLKGEHADEGFPPGYWDDYLNRFSIRVLFAS